ncbi:MAG: hypothetical protein ACHQF2_09940 [Flavobacteriales bacterium]
MTSFFKLFTALLFLVSFEIQAQHIHRDFLYGNWKLVRVNALEKESEYFIHENTSTDATYKGLNITQIDNKHVFLTQPGTNERVQYECHLKEPKGQHAQLIYGGKKNHLGTIFVHYVDADSLVLRHFYIDSTQQPQAFYNCYSRTDDKFRDLSEMKNKLMDKWWYCGSYQGIFEKDSLVMLSTSKIADTCKHNHCQQTTFDFNHDEFGLELDVLTRSYCEGDAEKLVSGSSFKWKLYTNHTVGVIIEGQKEVLYHPAFRNTSVLVLRKK